MDPEIKIEETPATTPTTPEVDDFADAFASLTTPAETPAVVAVPETPVVVAETPAAVAETPAAVAETSAAIAEVQSSVPDTNTEIAALKAQLAALQNPAPVAPAAPAPAAPAPIYTAEEQAQLTEYQASWPDVHAGEALIRRAEYRELVGYIFDQVRAQIDPALSFVQRQQGRTQYGDLIELVPDYDEVRDKTLAWVDTQPEYLKKAYKEVANAGSASDVADLINRFKKETNYASAAVPAAAPAAAPVAVAAPVKALPAAAAAAVASLKVVKSSRSEASTPVDSNNYDAAFAEFSQAK